MPVPLWMPHLLPVPGREGGHVCRDTRTLQAGCLGREWDGGDARSPQQGINLSVRKKYSPIAASRPLNTVKIDPSKVNKKQQHLCIGRSSSQPSGDSIYGDDTSPPRLGPAWHSGTGWGNVIWWLSLPQRHPIFITHH